MNNCSLFVSQSWNSFGFVTQQRAIIQKRLVKHIQGNLTGIIVTFTKQLNLVWLFNELWRFWSRNHFWIFTRIKNTLISNMKCYFISKVILCENQQKQQKEVFSYFEWKPYIRVPSIPLKSCITGYILLMWSSDSTRLMKYQLH